jgi:serine protease
VRKIGVAVVLAALMVLGEIVAGPVAPASADSTSDVPTTIGQANIGFQPGFLPALNVGDVLAGLPVTRVSRNGSFVTVAVPNLSIVRTALAAIPGVAYIEDNALMHTEATPNDPKLGQQYGPQMMGFPTAWGEVGYGSTSVTVGFVDTGILKTHEDLAGPRILQGHDYVNNDTNPDDSCGHGTHTAGILGATTNNALGIAGEAQVKILEMKALDSSFFGGCSGSDSDIAQAIMDAADQGAQIISMSIGGAGSSTMKNAVDYAYNKGVILVAAAGNDGQNNGVDFPGAYSNVIAVGALTSSKARASYSDGGPQLDISAPGSSVLSSYTDSNSSYTQLSGTSMATPGVAGALALALSCAPNGTSRDSVVNALYSTAQDLGAAGRDDAYGYGLARADHLVEQVCNVSPPANQPPTAAFTATGSGTNGVAVDASTSSDPDGDTLTYAWDFGDSTTGTDKTTTHTYSAPGTYSIKLTVNDGHGGTDNVTHQFTASASDPDPSTPNIASGQTVDVTVNSSATNVYYKINVPSGTTQLKAVTACNSGCPANVDLYTRKGQAPTNKKYDCKAGTAGDNEACTTANPASAYWYIRVKKVQGSGTVQLTVTLS